MTDSNRLSQLSRKLAEKPKSSRKGGGVVANPPHGEKGDFIKVTITLPPEVYGLLAEEAARRKMGKEKNAQVSAILREAALLYLKA